MNELLNSKTKVFGLNVGFIAASSYVLTRLLLDKELPISLIASYTGGFMGGAIVGACINNNTNTFIHEIDAGCIGATVGVVAHGAFRHRHALSGAAKQTGDIVGDIAGDATDMIT